MYPNNQSGFYQNTTSFSPFQSSNPCPKQRNITRPILIVHNYSLFFFGSIFNFLAFAILIKRSLRRHSTFAYLAFLSFSNGLLSLVHCSKWMLKYYFNIQIGNYLFGCRFDRFSSDFLTHFSLYTLVFVNIDRARTVTRRKPGVTRKKSQFRTVVLRELFVALILGIFHFHWMIKYGHQVEEGKILVTRCRYDDSDLDTIYYYFLTSIYPPLELIGFVCLPLLINIFCTVLIIRSLSVRMRRAKRFRNESAKDSEEMSMIERVVRCFLPKTSSRSNIYSFFCFQCRFQRHTELRLKLSKNEDLIKDEEQQTADNVPKETNSSNVISSVVRTTLFLNKQHRVRRARDIHLSAMLIGLNVFYLILNLPFNFHQAFANYLYESASDVCRMMFVGVLLDALQQTFFSTNFFLYVLTNRRFREEFYNSFSRFFSDQKRSREIISSTRTRAPNSTKSKFRSWKTRFQQKSTNEQRPNDLFVEETRISLNSDLDVSEFTTNNKTFQNEGKNGE